MLSAHKYIQKRTKEENHIVPSTNPEKLVSNETKRGDRRGEKSPPRDTATENYDVAIKRM